MTKRSVQRFTAAHRLRHKSEFDILYREGRRLHGSHFLILARPNQHSHARLGLAVAAKQVGNAVNRNRIKRIVRESFRIHLTHLPAWDIVVSARAPAKDAPNAVLAHSLAQLWDKLARHA